MASHIVPCPACGAANRIPDEKEGVAGRCGACRVPLPPLYLSPLHLTDQSFDRLLAGYPGTVVAEFWATWCSHCKNFAPVIAQAARALAGRAAFAQLDIDICRAAAGRFGITGVPALVLLRGGREIARTSGAMELNQLLNWLRQHGVG